MDPGSITTGFSKYCAEIVGLDASPEVIKQAEEHLQRNCLEEEGVDIRFMEGDVYDLPFEDGSFDFVHAHQVLQHLSDPLSALREMRRVARHAVSVREVDYDSWTWQPDMPRGEVSLGQDFLTTYKKVRDVKAGASIGEYTPFRLIESCIQLQRCAIATTLSLEPGAFCLNGLQG